MSDAIQFIVIGIFLGLSLGSVITQKMIYREIKYKAVSRIDMLIKKTFYTVRINKERTNKIKDIKDG